MHHRHAECTPARQLATNGTGALKMQSTFQGELLLSYSDADLVQFIHQVPRLSGHNAICLLSNNYLAKCYEVDEVEDTIRAVNIARRLGVRAPGIERAVKVDNYCRDYCDPRSSL